MTALILALAFAASDEIAVLVSPDHAFPQAYVGEPLVVELTSATTQTMSGSVELAYNGETSTVTFPEATLTGGRPYWLAFRGAELRGAYDATFRFGETAQSVSFVRTDRPLNVPSLPISVLVGAGGVLPPLGLLRALPTRRVTLYAGAPGMLQLSAELARYGFDVEVFFQSVPSEAYTFLEEHVSAWLVPVSNAEELEPLLSAEPSNGSTPQIVPALVSPRNFETILAAGIGPRFYTAVIYGEPGNQSPLRAYQLAAQRSGIENLRFEHVIQGEGTVGLAPGVVASWAEGYAAARVPMDAVFQAGNAKRGYAELLGLALRLQEPRYVGHLQTSAGVRVEAFRPRKGPAESWMAVCWSDSDQELSLSIGSATDLYATDAYNNPIALNTNTEGIAKVALTRGGTIVSGRGGEVLRAAALSRLGEMTDELLGTDGVRDVLRTDILSSIEAHRQGTADTTARFTFLGLIRGLPETEAAWHRGEIARARAVPILAALARCARAFCAFEQERGEPFIEPLHETLARGAEFQSLYLTGIASTRGPQERAEWILDEVSRLMAEARELADAGRAIEADAVAALAEWRARALQYAADAVPLSAPDPFAAVQSIAKEDDK